MSEQSLDVVVDRAFRLAVASLGIESQIVQMMENMPAYNLLSDSIFSYLEIFELPIQNKYRIVQLIDKDKLHGNIVAVFRESLDFPAIQADVETALFTTVDVDKLKNDLNAMLAEHRTNSDTSSSIDQLRIKLENVIERSIDKDKLNIAIVERMRTNMQSNNELGDQMSELFKSTILEAAIKFDSTEDESSV